MSARKIWVLACTVCLMAPWSTRLFAADGATFQGRDTKVMALSPDGSKLVSGGEDGTLKVWDPKTGISVIGDDGRALAAVFRQPDLQLQRDNYLLPDDGSDMNNAQVGPFCCTGKIVIVRSTNGDPVGYIYFFDWEGQAYNVEGGSIRPNLIVRVSGLSNFGDLDSDQIKNEIAFNADQLQLRSGWTPAGILQYRATVLDYKTVLGPDSKPYFFDSGESPSMRLRIDVQLAP